ncbi:MAG: hypothetical protein ACU0CA_07550 [Paracoccaceae bacterium]
MQIHLGNRKRRTENGYEDHAVIGEDILTTTSQFSISKAVSLWLLTEGFKPDMLIQFWRGGVRVPMADTLGEMV